MYPQMMALALLLVACESPSDSSKPESPEPTCDETPYTVCRVAGTGSPGAVETETEAIESPLYAPMDVAVFTGATDFIIGDWNNHKIRRVNDGIMQTIIGTQFLGDGDPDFQEREAPGIDGTNVGLNHPTSMEWSPATNKWIIPSWHNHRIREWDPETGLSLVVGANTDISDGNGANSGFAGDGGPAADALMSYPKSIAVHPDTGDFWLLDQRNHRIRFVSADYTLIDTIAGGDEAGFEGDGGPATEARFYFWVPEELQPEPSGAIEYDPERHRLYVADTSNHRIRVIDLDSGTIDSLDVGPVQTLPGGECDPGALCFPRDVEVDGDDLYIADTNNHVIRVFDLETGVLDVVAGSFEMGPTEMNEDALIAKLDTPHGIDVAPDGSILIADTYNHQILRVLP